MRYKLVIEYDGTEYCGWQVQASGRTIQGVLEEAIYQLSGERQRVAAAGRTDAGVHASGQVVSFVLDVAKPMDTVLRALNALTPRDITVRSGEIVAGDFDPRRAARRRQYVYRIWNERFPSPFHRRYTWHVARPLDLAAMQEGAEHLLGEHDFSALRAADCEADNPVRRITHSELRREGSQILYRIEATAFLKHMVRTIVGTLAEVGLGDRSAASIAAVLAARDRSLAGPTAPACGLCLTEVRYED